MQKKITDLLTSKNNKRLQMQDIARLSGVSTATVSRALNGSNLVNEKTRQRIAELAKSLNYTIDIGAQSLRLKQNKTIAVVIPFDAQNPQHVSDPFFLSMLGYIADEITKLGCYMLVSRISSDKLDTILEPYESGRAIGIIVIGQWQHHQQLNAIIANKPIVVWGAKMPNQHYVSVGSNNTRGGFLATEHLIQTGCKRIAFLGDTRLPEVAQRHKGYLKAHQKYDLAVSENICIPVPFTADTVGTEIKNLVKKSLPFDGVFACSDLIAMNAIGTLQKINLAVPQKVAVVGYDDISLAAYFHPAISTIRQPIEKGAQALVKALFAIIRHDEVHSEQLEISLVVRDSSKRTL